MRARLRGGILNKAHRGELCTILPVGFVYHADRRVVLDPDHQVQAAIRLLFQTFLRTGAATATVKYFREQSSSFRGQHALRVAIRAWSGARFVSGAFFRSCATRAM